MKFYLKALPLAISVALVPAAAFADEATDAKVAQLEQQVQALQAQQTKNLTDKFNFNGFISGAYISSDNDAGYNNATSSADFIQDSKMGLQATFNISNQTQAVLQLMMKGENDWDVEAEWAYLSHRFDGGVKVRGGKLRVPLFMYSDYLDVGFAQPFARPPGEVYDQVPFSSYTGGDVSYDFELEDSTLTLQGFGGESDVSGEVTSLDLSNMIGVNASWTDLTWTLRAVYGQTKIDGITNGLVIDNEKSVFNGLGGSYDNGSFLAVGEWTTVKIDGLLADTESAYVTFGYRIKSFTPYVTIAYVETTDNDVRSNLPPQLSLSLNQERTAYSAGLRWDAIDNVAIKFDLTYATDFGDTNGGMGGNGILNGGFDFSTGKFLFDDTLIYTVKFDAVF
jgi:hypothetical protein